METRIWSVCTWALTLCVCMRGCGGDAPKSCPSARPEAGGSAPPQIPSLGPAVSVAE